MSYEYTDFTYRIDSKTYSPPPPNFGPGNTRQLAVKMIPKGTLLFHHYLQVPKPAGFTQEEALYQNYATFLQRFAVQDCKYVKEEQAFEVCFSTTNSSSKFFFGVPAAGFGLPYLGDKYNACISFVTTRDMYITLLKSGTRIPDKEAFHRKQPISEPSLQNYDMDRVRVCNQFPENESCIKGNEWDPCLTQSYRLEKKIDGFTAISNPDCIVNFKYDPRSGLSVFEERDKRNKSKKVPKKMTLYLREFLQSIEDERDPRKKDLLMRLYNTMMLLLETDTKMSTVLAGFAEYATEPFGYQSADAGFFPGNYAAAGKPEPAASLFSVQEDRLDSTGKLVFRKVKVPLENMEAFVEAYLNPNLVVKPLSIHTPNGRIAPGQGAFKEMRPIQARLRAEINCDIAKMLFEEMGGVLYEQRSNVLILARSDVCARDGLTKTRLMCDTSSGLFPPNVKTINEIPIGHHDLFINDLKDTELASLFKLLQLGIANSRRTENGELHEYGYVDSFNNRFLVIPAGPIFQPFDPNLDSRYVMETLLDLLRYIEGEKPQQLHYNLNTQIEAIKSWLTFPYSKTANPKYHIGHFVQQQMRGGLLNSRQRFNLTRRRPNNTKKLINNSSSKNRTRRNTNRVNKMENKEEGRVSLNITQQTEETFQATHEMANTIAKGLFIIPKGYVVKPKKSLYSM